jgi:hypothetical protein
MDMHWTIYLQRDGADEKVPLARFSARSKALPRLTLDCRCPRRKVCFPAFSMR